MSELSSRASAEIELVNEHGTNNYGPLPVVLAEGKGAWVTDVDGKRYLDAVMAYSAANFGHSNDKFIDIACAQMRKLDVTSRTFSPPALASSPRRSRSCQASTAC